MFFSLGRKIWGVEYVGDTRHARCFDSCPKGMTRAIFAVHLDQPDEIALGERWLIAGIISEKEMGCNFIGRLGKRIGYAGGKQRGGKRGGG